MLQQWSRLSLFSTTKVRTRFCFFFFLIYLFWQKIESCSVNVLIWSMEKRPVSTPQILWDSDKCSNSAIAGSRNLRTRFQKTTWSMQLPWRKYIKECTRYIQTLYARIEGGGVLFKKNIYLFILFFLTVQMPPYVLWWLLIGVKAN